LILYNTQFSKVPALYGEPKEQFSWKCNEYRIRPQFTIANQEQQTLQIIVSRRPKKIQEKDESSDGKMQVDEQKKTPDDFEI
jgi:hypothetical protein